MKPVIRPNKRRNRRVLVCISLMFLTSIILFFYHWFSFYDSQLNNADKVLEWNRLRNEVSALSLLEILGLLIYIWAIIFYVQWFRRMYWNLEKLSGKTIFPNWVASAGWFIPIFHWIGPFIMTFETVSKSKRILNQANTYHNWTLTRIVIVLWCLFYFTSGLLLFIGIFTPIYEPSVFDIEYQINYDTIVRIIGFTLEILAVSSVWILGSIEEKIRNLDFTEVGFVTSNPELIDDEI